MLGDSKQILGVGEDIQPNNQLRFKRLWKFAVLYGITRQPIVGARHPAPTLLSIFLLCMLLTERTQKYCGEGEGKKGEARRGADTQ